MRSAAWIIPQLSEHPLAILFYSPRRGDGIMVVYTGAVSVSQIPEASIIIEYGIPQCPAKMSGTLDVLQDISGIHTVAETKMLKASPDGGRRCPVVWYSGVGT